MGENSRIQLPRKSNIFFVSQLWFYLWAWLFFTVQMCLAFESMQSLVCVEGNPYITCALREGKGVIGFSRFCVRMHPGRERVSTDCAHIFIYSLHNNFKKTDDQTKDWLKLHALDLNATIAFSLAGNRSREYYCSKSMALVKAHIMLFIALTTLANVRPVTMAKN